MEIIRDEMVDGRECVVVELPYSKYKAWLVKRIKGKDVKLFRSVELKEDIINILVKKVEPEIEGNLYDEFDVVDINAVSEYYTGLLEELESLDGIKKK